MPDSLSPGRTDAERASERRRRIRQRHDRRRAELQWFIDNRGFGNVARIIAMEKAMATDSGAHRWRDYWVAAASEVRREYGDDAIPEQIASHPKGWAAVNRANMVLDVATFEMYVKTGKTGGVRGMNF